jgi:diphthamide biosynthesis protein 2
MNVKDLELLKIVDIIINHNYKIVCLQFADEYLADCVDVYSALHSTLLSKKDPQSADIELYITADSSYGSSIDDVSAMHVSCDLIVMFGTDLSSSGTIPTIVAPFKKSYDVSAAAKALFAELQKSEGKQRTVVLLSDLCHYHLLDGVRNEVSQLLGAADNVTTGRLPGSADLDAWSAAVVPETDRITVGGLSIEASFASPSVESAEERIVVYIGEKEEQLQNILFSLSELPVVHFAPDSEELRRIDLGLNSRELRARYGGIARVKDAKVVGLLIGSMGLSQAKMQATVQRMESFIAAAKKKCYVFVMGRLNEAKLCNFPEVDLFCLIGNDDNCYIPPKTFPVPVITPFELEIGLGARSWTAHLETLGDAAELSEDEVQRMSELIREYFVSSGGESESEEEESAAMTTTYTGAAGEDEEGEDGPSSSSVDCGASTAIVRTLKPEEQQLVDFKSSPAIEFFQNRQYQGLVSTIVDPANAFDGAEVESDHGTVNINKIHQGAVGIASKYER